MDAFSYLSVLLSIILGMAITQILKGYRGLMQSRARLVVYWPSIIWSVLLLVLAVQSWWAMFGLRHHEDWTFLEFATVLAQQIVMYLLAALVLPDFFGDAAVDLRAHYYGQQRWFFVLLVLLVGISLTKEFLITGSIGDPTNLLFHLLFAALGIGGATIREARYHSWMTGLAVVAIGAYVGLLFRHLS